jgi:hypothetical protein
MKRIIRLTEQDLARIVRRVIREEDQINSPEGVNKNPILKEDCVKSMALIDPNTGKPAYIDSKTGKYCKPKTEDYKGFASSVIGKMMPAIDSWNPLDAPENQIIYTQVHRIDSQEKYDAVAALCKTSPVLKEKYGYNEIGKDMYYTPLIFPFYTVMSFIQLGYSINMFTEEDNYKTLESYATHLRQFNPNEKVYKPKR